MWEFITAVIVAALTGYATFRIQEERLKKELKTEFMAEKVAKELLSDEKWTLRSFEAIRKRLGGFEDDELRKILVRAGAVRFEGDSKEELWGLIERNKSKL
jgi:hypothetical protein